MAQYFRLDLVSDQLQVQAMVRRYFFNLHCSPRGFFSNTVHYAVPRVEIGDYALNPEKGIRHVGCEIITG